VVLSVPHRRKSERARHRPDERHCAGRLGHLRGRRRPRSRVTPGLPSERGARLMVHRARGGRVDVIATIGACASASAQPEDSAREQRERKDAADDATRDGTDRCWIRGRRRGSWRG
jgi:hypothetical protein